MAFIYVTFVILALLQIDFISSIPSENKNSIRVIDALIMDNLKSYSSRFEKDMLTENDADIFVHFMETLFKIRRDIAQEDTHKKRKEEREK